MTKEANEAPIRPIKVLTFFNYKKIIQDLSIQLLNLGAEYRALSGKNELPENYLRLDSNSSNVHIARPPQQNTHQTKRIVRIDNQQVIHQLKQRISLLSEAMLSLNRGSKGAHTLESGEYPSVQSSPISHTDTKNDELSTSLSIELLPETISAQPENQSDSSITFSSHCSGIFPNYERVASFLSNSFDPKLGKYAKATYGELSILQLSPKLKFEIYLLQEQPQFDYIRHQMEKSVKDLQILFFCLSTPSHAAASYKIAKDRFQIFNGLVKMHCLVGLYDNETPNTEALTIFNQFRQEYSIENTLVCQYSVEAQEKYTEFMLEITNKLMDIPQATTLLSLKKLPDPHIKQHAYALLCIHHATIALKKDKLFDALKWADLALKNDPSIFNPTNTLNFPATFDFVQIVTKKIADQDFFTYVEGCPFDYSQINSNPTKEYFLSLKDKPLFLEYIKKYESMINSFDRSQEPILHVAARFGYHHFITWLLDNGTPVDLQAHDGRTALIVAAFYGHEPLINLLIQKGANVFHEATNSMTPLLMASQSGHFSMVKLFVEKYKDMELRRHHINMANVYAAIYGSINIIQYFLDLGADINFRNPKGLSPLCSAAAYENISTVKYLLAHGAKPNNTNSNNESELSLIIGHNSREMVKLLVAHGADVNFSGKIGMTPLLKAAGYGRIEEVKYLVKKGAHVNIISKNITPLMGACMEGHLNVVTYLVEECSADVNQRSNFSGQNALMAAVGHNRLEIVEYLLDHGTHIDTIKENGWTALTLAADDGRRNIVSLLLSRGANPKNIGNASISAEGLKMIEEEYAKLQPTSTTINSTAEPEPTHHEKCVEEEHEEDADNEDRKKSDKPNGCSLM